MSINCQIWSHCLQNNAANDIKNQNIQAETTLKQSKIKICLNKTKIIPKLQEKKIFLSIVLIVVRFFQF
jgi:hypothetical protein